ncbi:hypothetical protein K492DRAFT_184448 [Lichtheimia hyalospora FSU 10163]|nr:hypothetical protein K492DRAFT_184448 [Lichtheimia hyalospora FSU 10163]
MKTSFLAFAAVFLATSLDLTTAAACDQTTQVDHCDHKECTYQNFNVTHVPDKRKDTKWEYYSFSCVKPEDPSKCEDIKQEDECLASQCTWNAYYEKARKTGEYKTFSFCMENVGCGDVRKNKDICTELDHCKYNEQVVLCVTYTNGRVDHEIYLSAYKQLTITYGIMYQQLLWSITLRKT